jgi:hypothetical protein
MWYYAIHGNNSQLLERSEPEYNTEREAVTAGGKMAARLVQWLEVVLSVQTGRKDG